MNSSTSSVTLAYVEHLTVYSSVIVVGTIGMIGNGLIILTFIKQPTLTKNGRGLHLIGFLALGDLVLVFGSVFLSFFKLYEAIINLQQFTRLYCIGQAFPTVAGIYMSHTLTVVVAYDRYKAMVHPLEYFNEGLVLKNSKLKLFSVFSFAFLNALCMFPGVNLHSQPPKCRFGSSVHKIATLHYSFLVIGLGFLVFYFYIRALVGLKSNRVSADNHSQAAINAYRFQVKITNTTATILGVYCFVWFLPNVLFIATVNLNAEFRGRLTPYIGLLGAANSAFNVFVYSTKSSIIRPYLVATVKNKLHNSSSIH